jgi:23S rRNA pseudouridine1911/1915/1917 synthase
VTGFGLLHEDRSFLVVDKPAGVHTAPLRPGESGTLLEAVIAAFPEVAQVPGMKSVEPGLLHRLDRETSGIVVIARTAEAFTALRASFDDGRALKFYRAACVPAEGVAGAPGQLLSVESRFAPLGRGGHMVRVVLDGETTAKVLRGAAAALYRTDAVVERVGRGRALVSASLARGFRHQVRAHLAYAGFPIVGDPLYGAQAPTGAEARMYLHAYRIELPHPETGAEIVVEAPLPACFPALLEEDTHGLS